MYSIIDTFTLCMSCTRWYKTKNVITGKYYDTIDWSYTARLQQKITSKMFQNEQDKQNVNRVVKVSEYKWKKAKVNWHRKYKGYVFNYYENWHSLTIMVPHYKLENYKATEILKDVTAVIQELFEIATEDLNEILLNRLDIKVDYRYKDDEEYQIIKNILSKVSDKYYSYQKQVKKDDETGYILTFSRLTDIEYNKGPVTTSNKIIENKLGKRVEDEEDIGNNMEIEQYDKMRQVEQSIADGKVPESYRDKYVNVFRTEVRIRNARLNYYKNKMGTTKNLENYCDDFDLLYEIYIKPTKTLFGTNNYYRVDTALQVINGSKKRNTTKIKLCELVELINQKGYSAAKDEWTNRYCTSTFRNNIKQIEALGINTITYDKQINNKTTSVEVVRNFTLLENRVAICYDDENYMEEVDDYEYK